MTVGVYTPEAYSDKALAEAIRRNAGELNSALLAAAERGITVQGRVRDIEGDFSFLDEHCTLEINSIEKHVEPVAL